MLSIDDSDVSRKAMALARAAHESIQLRLIAACEGLASFLAGDPICSGMRLIDPKRTGTVDFDIETALPNGQALNIRDLALALAIDEAAPTPKAKRTASAPSRLLPPMTSETLQHEARRVRETLRELLLPDLVPRLPYDLGLVLPGPWIRRDATPAEIASLFGLRSIAAELVAKEIAHASSMPPTTTAGHRPAL